MRKVILVDDEPFIVEGLKAMIPWESYGFEIVATFENGRKAFEYLKRNSVALVFADIKMPEMTGLELLEKVRSELKLDTHFVLLSGYSDFAYAQQALRSKCTDYILKPTQKIEVLEILERVAKEIGCNPSEEEALERVIQIESENKPEFNQFRENPCKRNAVLSEIEQEMRNHYMDNITLKALGQKYYMNSTYLGQLFQKQFGKSFQDYLNEIRLSKACDLLLTTDEKIFSIAFDVGYKDADYFIEKFIATYGCTPTTYRKQRR